MPTTGNGGNDLDGHPPTARKSIRNRAWEREADPAFAANHHLDPAPGKRAVGPQTDFSPAPTGGRRPSTAHRQHECVAAESAIADHADFHRRRRVGADGSRGVGGGHRLGSGGEPKFPVGAFGQVGDRCSAGVDAGGLSSHHARDDPADTAPAVAVPEVVVRTVGEREGLATAGNRDLRYLAVGGDPAETGGRVDTETALDAKPEGPRPARQRSRSGIRSRMAGER